MALAPSVWANLDLHSDTYEYYTSSNACNFFAFLQYHSAHNRDRYVDIFLSFVFVYLLLPMFSQSLDVDRPFSVWRSSAVEHCAVVAPPAELAYLPYRPDPRTRTFFSAFGETTLAHATLPTKPRA